MFENSQRSAWSAAARTGEPRCFVRATARRCSLQMPVSWEISSSVKLFWLDLTVIIVPLPFFAWSLNLLGRFVSRALDSLRISKLQQRNCGNIAIASEFHDTILRIFDAILLPNWRVGVLLGGTQFLNARYGLI